jgi:uncharacterized membrane protein YqjE
MATNETSDLGRAIQDVSDRASLLVREEIELAKAEMTEKASGIARGAVIGIVAGIFAVFGLIYLLNALAWALWELLGTETNYWLGFLIVGVALFIFGAIAAFVASRLVRKATPPKPEMAIEEAQLIRETVRGQPPSEVGA